MSKCPICGAEGGGPDGPNCDFDCVDTTKVTTAKVPSYRKDTRPVRMFAVRGHRR